MTRAQGNRQAHKAPKYLRQFGRTEKNKAKNIAKAKKLKDIADRKRKEV